jgi:hypothetical protein
MPSIELTDIEGNSYPDSMFNLSFDTYDSPLPVLYQSGYLTIKDFKRTNRMNMYRLGFPNAEVRTGFADCLYQAVVPVKGIDNNKAVFLNAYNDFWEAGDLPQFIEAIKTFYAGIPYQWEQDNKNEHYYHALLYTLLTAFGADITADITAEEPSGMGRADHHGMAMRQLGTRCINYHWNEFSNSKIREKTLREQFFFPPFCERLGVFSQAAAFAKWHPKMFFFFFSKRSGF